MKDELGLSPDEETRPVRIRPERRHRALTWSIVVVLLVVVAGGVYAGLRHVGVGNPPDYSGTGTTDVVFHVRQGASLRSIGESMNSADIVASGAAFVVATRSDADSRSIQPGYYLLKHHMSARSALAALEAPASRVGKLEVRPGARLADVHKPGGGVRPGIFTLLAKASCADVNGHSTCVSAKELRDTAQGTSLAELGVPGWAARPVSAVPAEHRLEGLIAPEVYNVRPGATPEELLHGVLTESFETYSNAGLPAAARSSGFSAYEILTIASLSQAEGIQSDFAKIARVTDNRLAAGKELQYDSTVNYLLDRPELATSPEDRAKQGPYNTYAHTGLPPTPIDSPGGAAIHAALHPAKGKWMFFVRCHKDGSSCFSRTAAQHARQVKKAQARGAY